MGVLHRVTRLVVFGCASIELCDIGIGQTAQDRHQPSVDASTFSGHAAAAMNRIQQVSSFGTTRSASSASATEPSTVRQLESVGPNSRTWTTTIASSGSTTSARRTSASGNDPSGWMSHGSQHRVQEVASGMSFFDSTTGSYAPSVPAFEFVQDDQGPAFVANRVQHKIRLSADNLNVAGALALTSPDGITLQTTPVAIALYHARSDAFQIVATLTNSSGILAESNRVVYQNAFSGLCCDIEYLLAKGSFSQTVIFRGKFSPLDWGFPDTNSTRVLILSEFYQSQDPEVTTKPLYVENRPCGPRRDGQPGFG